MSAVEKGTVEALQRGRDAYERHEWTGAYEALADADRAAELGAEDLELLATSAYMVGREDVYVRALERAHAGHMGAGDDLRAVRCAWWIAITHSLRGEAAPAAGWLARARRLVDRHQGETVERGYLACAATFEHEARGDHDAAIAAAAEAVEIAERFGDRDLFALSAQDGGILLIREGRVDEGLELLDEAMVAVTSGELSPIASGYVYCGVIIGCQHAYDLRRAREWTSAMTRWCEQQPEMIAFSGTCLVHRAEIMQVHGVWPDALEEARLAGERSARAMNHPAAAEAVYRQGEIHRLRGKFAEAERAYREASAGGREPQPGLALLRLAQGKHDAAAAAIRRRLTEVSAPSARAALLPASVEIALAAGDAPGAREACAELTEIAARWHAGLLAATATHARAALEVAGGDAAAALIAAREAGRAWQELGAPYEVARARVLTALACRGLGDDDSAALELEAARAAFAELGAVPDLAHVDSLTGAASAPDAHGLTARELEVLRLIAAGNSNRAIAAELVISEYTVARHAQNIFAKLGVSSRTAASAFAFSHDLA